MASGAQLSVTDLRRSTRHPVDQPVLAEHRRLGDIPLHVVNISAHGFMTDSVSQLTRGERVTIRLPVIGRIESHLIWSTGDRAGFQFERIIRLDEFNAMIAAIQPNPRLRKER
jgi:hypothetical protein